MSALVTDATVDCLQTAEDVGDRPVVDALLPLARRHLGCLPLQPHHDHRARRLLEASGRQPAAHLALPRLPL